MIVILGLPAQALARPGGWWARAGGVGRSHDSDSGWSGPAGAGWPTGRGRPGCLLRSTGKALSQAEPLPGEPAVLKFLAAKDSSISKR